MQNFKITLHKKAKKGRPEIKHTFHVQESDKAKLLYKVQEIVREQYGEGYSIKITELGEIS